jgi:cephalosporin hydroxylase
MKGIRDFSSILGPELLEQVQSGVMRTTYRGIPMLKSPFDIVIYLQLIQRLRPRTVFEIGTRFGGSALWFADALTNHDIESPRIVSIDIRQAASFQDPRIRFLQGNAGALDSVLMEEVLADCRHPFLVVEDSSHTYGDVTAVLRFFHPRLVSGDYIVVEDGVVAHMAGDQYARYENGPNRAVEAFLLKHGDSYEIDVSLCDHFGRNATYNPNGWLKRL